MRDAGLLLERLTRWTQPIETRERVADLSATSLCARRPMRNDEMSNEANGVCFFLNFFRAPARRSGPARRRGAGQARRTAAGQQLRR